MKKFVLAVCMFFWSLLPVTSPAATMSDIWWTPSESGWGVNIVEQQGTLFITMYIYGSDGMPTWLVGSSVSLVSSTTAGRIYTGALFQATGPWFGGFFNPSAVGVRQVGTVTFTATSPVRGTLQYSADGVSVTKIIERYAFKHINLSGTYYGATDALSDSTCALTGNLTQPFYTAYTLTALVSQVNARQGTLTMTLNDGTSTITFSGQYTQYGALYEVAGTMTFPGQGTFTASIRDFTADDDGVRGNIYLLSPSGCVIDLRFSAVKPG